MSDLLDLCTSNATWDAGRCAEVCVGGHVTRYVRRGAGPSVVLVGADANTNPLVYPLITRLAPNHRLIVPQVPTGDDLTSWLRGFIEGIGLAEVALIAGDVPSAAAAELAAADDFTIRRLVVLPRSSVNGRSNGHQSTERILWVDADWTPENAVMRIASFIADEAAV